MTLRKHIEVVSHISKGGDVSSFMEDMKPLAALDFIREINESYPIEKNIRMPKDINNVFVTIDSLVLGQFIMLEQIITGKTKLPDHLVDFEILKLLSRPKHHTEFDNENIDDEKVNSDRLLEMDVRECYWILTNYINNREYTLFKQFSGVFYEPAEEDDEDEDSAGKAGAEMLFNQQWYWYSIVRMLSCEDIHRYEETYMLSMRTVLPEMSFLAQKGKIDSARQRESQAMRKL